MIRIESTADAIEAIGDARASGVALWLQGTGTHPQLADGTVVSTLDLGEVVEYRPDDLTIRVQPGLSLDALRDVLGPHRQTAVLPEVEGNRTIGGVVASGASGYSRLKYGPTRDRVLGVTMATGYGQAVVGGGQLVKNVTGYDLPRLATGSYGALGVITELTLKLWPSPPASSTVEVSDAAAALARMYRPLAVLETDKGSFVMVEGSEQAVAEQVDASGGSGSSGLSWPQPIDSPVKFSVRVTPRSLDKALAEVRGSGASRWIGHHGVGRIDAGIDSLTSEELLSLRSAIGSFGGVVVVDRHPDLDRFDRWGNEPAGIDIQWRLKQLFDPDRVLNPGVLPGGI